MADGSAGFSDGFGVCAAGFDGRGSDGRRVDDDTACDCSCAAAMGRARGGS
ncbi:hypothetical protein SHKM778_81640 [Streptomyces sp. KM77-8]|uniref:Uncharacterized protein n=1 Tax=Streptomyces haneummycinicus TaxID=3074435 RepID=A0AAT9HXD7_9ACTN